MKVADVSNLAGLSNPIALLLESTLCIELESPVRLIKEVAEEQQTHNNGSRSAFAMITMDHYDILLIF